MVFLVNWHWKKDDVFVNLMLCVPKKCFCDLCELTLNLGALCLVFGKVITENWDQWAGGPTPDPSHWLSWICSYCFCLTLEVDLSVNVDLIVTCEPECGVSMDVNVNAEMWMCILRSEGEFEGGGLNVNVGCCWLVVPLSAKVGAGWQSFETCDGVFFHHFTFWCVQLGVLPSCFQSTGNVKLQKMKCTQAMK